MQPVKWLSLKIKWYCCRQFEQNNRAKHFDQSRRTEEPIIVEQSYVAVMGCVRFNSSPALLVLGFVGFTSCRRWWNWGPLKYAAGPKLDLGIKEVNAGQFSDQRSKAWSRQEIQICWRENGGKLQSHANVLRCTVIPIRWKRKLSVHPWFCSFGETFWIEYVGQFIFSVAHFKL